MGRIVLAGILFLVVAAVAAHAGSTEPELAIASASASVDSGLVSVEILGNFDYGNVTRLGYPLAIVATQGSTQAQLFLDGVVTVSSNGGPAVPVPDAPGVVAIAPLRLRCVLPPGFSGAGSAMVQLEATFDGATLRSNTVEVVW